MTRLVQNFFIMRILLVASLIGLPAQILTAQPQADSGLGKSAPQTGGERRSFEVISIRPIAPGTSTHVTGFRALPGGRIDIVGIGIRQLMSQAFHIPTNQIKGGPDWLDTQGYAIVAIPPDDSPSRKQEIESFTPTEEQRQMLRELLAERFSLRYHEEMRSGAAYVITRGRTPLKLEPPSDPTRTPAFAIFMRGDVFDGETRGANLSMAALAQQLSPYLNTPVIDQSGLAGAYDFHVEPFAPENKDVEYAATGAMSKLGLNLKRESRPTKTVVIDKITKPTPN